MFSTLVMALLEHFEELDRTRGELANAILADSQLPFALFGGPVDADRKAAIAAITRLSHTDDTKDEPKAGLLCSRPATLTCAAAFNSAKDRFQGAIQAFRQHTPELQKMKLAKLIDTVLKREGRRTDALSMALKRLDLGRLDLVKCYCHVRVLPAHLQSISYTWAKTHARITKVSMREAQAMAQKLPSEEVRDLAFQLLSALPPGTALALKKPLKNQLRANLLSLGDDDEIVKESTPISGIALSPDSTLPPTVLWRDDPNDSEQPPPPRKGRRDARISSEPYIKALHLHLYNRGPA